MRLLSRSAWSCPRTITFPTTFSPCGQIFPMCPTAPSFACASPRSRRAMRRHAALSRKCSASPMNRACRLRPSSPATSWKPSFPRLRLPRPMLPAWTRWGRLRRVIAICAIGSFSPSIRPMRAISTMRYPLRRWSARMRSAPRRTARMPFARCGVWACISPTSRIMCLGTARSISMRVVEQPASIWLIGLSRCFRRRCRTACARWCPARRGAA